ncbi:MAG: hypothetical protein M3Z32_13910 [Acidobacteriota bacterium]|nr:hypothetical protein [Acidobacteriota bacterium]
MNAFIVRPFGKKKDIDFDAVERDLIDPALTRLGVTGRTTAEITRAGNIRSDMFELLLTADLVIADISIHNANVFYELGVRHALRDKRTFLLRASIDEVPFDLKTDRYLSYDPAKPGACLEALVAGLFATIRGEQTDSPVFAMVPGLPVQDVSRFVIVPAQFREEVDRAFASKEAGDLQFLVAETSGLRWRREGLRVIGEAQFRLKDMSHAVRTWEAVRGELEFDVQANLRLGTIYQKLGDLASSTQALTRIIEKKDLSTEQIAEARALLASNAKTSWIADWWKLPAAGRPAAALRSGCLFDAFDEYEKGFAANLNHYYSGLNALAMVTIITELAAAAPDTWLERYGEDDAPVKLRQYTKQRTQLTGAVDFSIRAERQRLARSDREDVWLDVSYADFSCLTGRTTVAQDYRDALRNLDPFSADAVRRQLDLYQALGILTKPVNSSLPVFPAGPEVTTTAKPTFILFTGHRVDDDGRPKPRFPKNQQATARDAIQKEVRKVVQSAPGPVIAVSGGASGGDLLFMEICEELKIERRMFLIMPRDEYVAASVEPSGDDWVTRFDHQYETAQRRVYQRSKDMPSWLDPKPNYSIWERCNLWMLENVLWHGAQNTTLIALWDGAGGDGPGGTKHMVDSMRGRGARSIVINTVALFGLG